MKEIIYIKGDATDPSGDGTKMICHICNNSGRWGRGFVLALSKKWTDPELKYRNWFLTKTISTSRSKQIIPFRLGMVQYVYVAPEILVANMIAQNGTVQKYDKSGNIIPLVHYLSLDKCLEKCSGFAKELNASVHMPRIGCGLGGGKWEIIEPMIKEIFSQNDIQVVVYDFE